MISNGRAAGLLGAAALAAAAPAHAANPWQLEAGRETAQSTFANPNFTAVTFATPFAVVPIVVALSTNEGGDPSVLRIRNVTTTGFEVAPLEPPGNDGPHIDMTFDYIAMTPGVNKLPTGEIVVAGRHTTNSVQRAGNVGGPNAWDVVPFGASLAAPASVIAAVQTANSESGVPPAGPATPWLSVAARNADADSVELALERSEVAAGAVVAEDIGFIAFPGGGSGAFEDDAGLAVDWTSTVTGATIAGWDNGCFTAAFSPTAFANARVVATKSSRFGADGGWLRRCSLNATEVGLQVDEDVSNDAERAHTNEIAAILAFSGSFHATFEAQLAAVKTVSATEDPVNGAAGPYFLPGARARYAIAVESQGDVPVDNDALVFVDPIPPQTRLVVADIGGAGSGPVRFTDGAPSSNLTYSFGGLADAGDDLDFSNDNGATFTYAPTAGPDGSDPAVTHIRVRPGGEFAGETGGARPTFRLEFDVIVD